MTKLFHNLFKLVTKNDHGERKNPIVITALQDVGEMYSIYFIRSMLVINKLKNF